VTNKWLSPDIIAEKLNEVDLAKTILDFIQQPKHQQSGIRLIQNIIKIRKQNGQPKFADACKKILKSRL
jgi:uncharacterized membrane-anchored protein YjiN (DUF445 family)